MNPPLAHYLPTGLPTGTYLHGCDSVDLSRFSTGATFLEIGAGSIGNIDGAWRHLSATGATGHRTWRQLAHPLELLTRSNLLGEQGGLDSVEQTLQPADELGFGNQ